MAVEQEKFLLAQKVAKMTAQMKVFKQDPSAPTSEPTSPALETFDSAKIKQELENEYSFLPTPELSFGHPASSLASPSTMTYSPSQSPPNVGLGLADPLTSSTGLTQHPAAMLCDLQCQLVEATCQASATRPTTRPTRPTVTRLSLASLPSPMLISAAFSRPTGPQKTPNSSKTVSSPAQTSHLTEATHSPLTPLSILTPGTTPMAGTTTWPTSATTTTSRGTRSKTLPIPPLRLRPSLLLSSPTRARPHRAATVAKLRLETGRMTGEETGASRTICALKVSPSHGEKLGPSRSHGNNYIVKQRRSVHVKVVSTSSSFNGQIVRGKCHEMGMWNAVEVEAGVGGRCQYADEFFISLACINSRISRRGLRMKLKLDALNSSKVQKDISPQNFLFSSIR